MPLCWDRFPPSVPRTPASTGSQWNDKSDFSAVKQERSDRRKKGCWLVYTQWHTHIQNTGNNTYSKTFNHIYALGLKVTLININTSFIHMRTPTHQTKIAKSADVWVLMFDIRTEISKLYSIYCCCINKSHQKIKTNIVSVHLSTLPDFPTLAVALSPKHINSYWWHTVNL